MGAEFLRHSGTICPLFLLFIWTFTEIIYLFFHLQIHHLSINNALVWPDFVMYTCKITVYLIFHVLLFFPEQDPSLCIILVQRALVW